MSGQAIFSLLDYSGAAGTMFLGAQGSNLVNVKTRSAQTEEKPTEMTGSVLALSVTDPIRYQLLRLSAIAGKDNWDGDGAVALQRGAVPIVYKLLSADELSALPQPEIDVDNDGEVNLSWYGKGNKSFTVTINGEGRLAYALYIPNGTRFSGVGNASSDLSLFKTSVRQVLG